MKLIYWASFASATLVGVAICGALLAESPNIKILLSGAAGANAFNVVATIILLARGRP